MLVTVASSVIETVLRHAALDPSREVCGLLLEDDYGVEAAFPTLNVARTPEAAFEIDPAALIAAERAAREGGPRVAGYYHSHPNGVPEPSPLDAARAAPDGRLWLIAAAGKARGFRAGPDGPIHGRFTPVTIRAA